MRLITLFAVLFVAVPTTAQPVPEPDPGWPQLVANARWEAGAGDAEITLHLGIANLGDATVEGLVATVQLRGGANLIETFEPIEARRAGPVLRLRQAVPAR